MVELEGGALKGLTASTDASGIKPNRKKRGALENQPLKDPVSDIVDSDADNSQKLALEAKPSQKRKVQVSAQTPDPSMESANQAEDSDEPIEDDTASERPKKKAKTDQAGLDKAELSGEAADSKSHEDLTTRLRGAWGKEEIIEQMKVIEAKIADDSSPRKTLRLKQRLAKLKKALEGKGTVGGQLKKKSKNEYHIRKGHARNADRHHTCLRCRQQGHRLVNCPMNETKAEGDVTEYGITGQCFLCGKSGHRLKDCPQSGSGKTGALPFAQCFLCGETGHIVANCPLNDAGIYPRGGACFHCGKNDHRKNDCPTMNQKEKVKRPTPSLKDATPDEAWSKVLKHSRKEGAIERKQAKKNKIRKK
eukprot:Selendium_serpulae@DN5384_c0_g1_i10.p2